MVLLFLHSINTSHDVQASGDVHENGIPMGMGFPREWELDLNKDGNRNPTVTRTRECERLKRVDFFL